MEIKEYSNIICTYNYNNRYKCKDSARKNNFYFVFLFLQTWISLNPKGIFQYLFYVTSKQHFTLLTIAAFLEPSLSHVCMTPSLVLALWPLLLSFLYYPFLLYLTFKCWCSSGFGLLFCFPLPWL